MSEQREQKRHHIEKCLMVFDRDTEQYLGGMANLSPKGAMFVTQEPVKRSTVFRCRVELAQPIVNRSEVLFSAQCRWCRKNETKGWYESGYRLEADSDEDQEVLSFLVLQFVIAEWAIPSASGVS
jgi:hypothetical protein